MYAAGTQLAILGRVQREEFDGPIGKQSQENHVQQGKDGGYIPSRKDQLTIKTRDEEGSADTHGDHKEIRG